MIQMKKSLEDLKGQRAQIIAQARRDAPQGDGSAYNVDKNPIYQQMRISMAQLEADVAAKKRLLSEYEAQVAELEGSIDKVLALEAERRDLMSDYEIAKRTTGCSRAAWNLQARSQSRQQLGQRAVPRGRSTTRPDRADQSQQGAVQFADPAGRACGRVWCRFPDVAVPSHVR